MSEYLGSILGKFDQNKIRFEEIEAVSIDSNTSKTEKVIYSRPSYPVIDMERQWDQNRNLYVPQPQNYRQAYIQSLEELKKTYMRPWPNEYFSLFPEERLGKG